MPATSANTTIFRCVLRSADWIEWFILASRRPLPPLVGNRLTPCLFLDGFVGSPKWFRRYPLRNVEQTLRATAVRRKLPPGALMRSGEKNNENNPQESAWRGVRRLGNDHPQQARQRRGRVRVQTWRQYAGYPSPYASTDRGRARDRHAVVRPAERHGFPQQSARRRPRDAVASSRRRHRIAGGAEPGIVDAGAALGSAERRLRIPVLRPS